MSYIDIFNQRNAAYGSTLENIRVDDMRRNISKSFTSSPSYHEVTFNNSPTPIGVQIVDDSATKEQKILSTLDSTYDIGDIVHWNGEKWLTLIVDDMAGIYKRSSIKFCDSSLKWLDSNGAIREAYFTQQTFNQHNLGLQEDKMMILSNERRSIIVQKNADTSQIRKNQRFIFDENRCWKVVGINSLTTNLITLELEETQLKENTDNVSLRIADYFIHDYSLHISNGSSVNLTANDALQLEIVVKDNGTITTLPLTYSSSDPSIVTVDENGLITAIAYGTADISVSLTNSPSIIETLSVEVSEVVQAGWTLDIVGNDYCLSGHIQRFRGEVKNNGVTDTSKLVRWTLYDDSGTVPTTLGYIVTQSGSEVVIKANKQQLGHLKIKGTCYANNNLTVEDIATYSVADLSTLTVDDLASVGFNSQNAEQYAVQNVDGLFNLGLTTEQMASFTVEDLAAYTVGDLANQTVLVSAVKRVQVKGLI